ncbi:hypothetical protein L210DRAFT_2219547 [Boletus edulis BED1]|uniref:Uncharacterized protein n=1 Tax=Boletus edulis BED1 TaxID=1328754 RepID=A0AAD4BDY7_BOLED|nr:hypothetical protein L210DRAFT_2219547 [Boletus edulis BED1]
MSDANRFMVAANLKSRPLTCHHTAVSFTVRRSTPVSRPSSFGPESDGPFKIPALPRHLASAGSSATGSPLAGSPRTFSSREDSDDDGETGIVFANRFGADDASHNANSSDEEDLIASGQRCIMLIRYPRERWSPSLPRFRWRRGRRWQYPWWILDQAIRARSVQQRDRDTLTEDGEGTGRPWVGILSRVVSPERHRTPPHDLVSSPHHSHWFEMAEASLYCASMYTFTSTHS